MSVDVFWLLAMIGVVMVPIALSLKRIDLGGGLFRFTLDVVHARFGPLLRQSALFREATS